MSVQSRTGDSGQAGKNDEQGGGGAEGEQAGERVQDKDDDIQAKGKGIHDRFFPEAQDCLQNQDTDTDPDSGKGMLNQRLVGEIGEKHGNDQDDENRTGEKAGGCGQSAPDAVAFFPR